MNEKINWLKIRNEYINGNISYRKLAEKYGIPFSTLKFRAKEENWFENRKKQRNKIETKLAQKTAEKLAEKEADRLARISDAADVLLDKIEAASQQLDQLLVFDKRRYMHQLIKDKDTGNLIDAQFEETVPKCVQIGIINKSELRQLTAALKDLKDIQLSKSFTDDGSAANISITVSAAAPEAAAEEEEEENAPLADEM